jgi:hypothetical protein
MELIIISKKYGQKIVLFDEQDAHLVDAHTWHVRFDKSTGGFYVLTNIPKGKKQTSIVLHRLLMEFPDNQVDHINRDGLDNRRDNLRMCTNAENGRNKGNFRNNKSGYKGVHYHIGIKRWVAYITVNYKRISGGCFDTAKDAATRYNELAIIHHGDFAKLNIIE